MSQHAVMIENRLHSAGYKTQRIGGEVQVFDPVYRSVAGLSGLVLSHHEMVEVRSIHAAWAFIEERS
ncbi:hypothetical protein [Gulbenkiania mobilis]|uniref:hypothetical protein n=1 Tax=Gulbenkiania mobilis TaxID=397457 RepID=UPI0009F8BFD5|nr:hypothetical protein [Gulbenkiania mobilis]